MTEQPGRERRRDLARDEGRREIPGRERGGDADRLMADLEPSSRHPAFDDPAIDSTGLLGVPAKLVGGQRPFPLRLRERLAGLAGDHASRFICAPNHFVCDRMDGVGAREGRSRAPGFQPRLGGVERFFGISDAGDRGLAQRRLGHRAEHRRRGAIRGLPPLAAYEKSEPSVHVKEPPKPLRRGFPRPISARLPRAPGRAARPRTRRPAAFAARQLRRRRRFRRRTPPGSAR